MNYLKNYKLTTQDTLVFRKNTKELIILLNYYRIKIFMLRIIKRSHKNFINIIVCTLIISI